METTQQSSGETGGLGPRLAAILATALVAGLAYNSASPLGVQLTRNTTTVTAVTPAPGVAPPAAVAPAPMATPKTTATTSPLIGSGGMVYHNETVGIKFHADAGTMAAVPAAPAAPPSLLAPEVNVPVLTWPETKALLAGGRILLVDARKASAYQAEHIPGAISLPAESPAADVAAFTAKHPRDTAMVVYCGSSRCPLSRQLISVFTSQLGYTNVRDMPGGYVEYRQMEAKPPAANAPAAAAGGAK